jgi:hypothetical protein
MNIAPCNGPIVSNERDRSSNHDVDHSHGRVLCTEGEAYFWPQCLELAHSSRMWQHPSTIMLSTQIIFLLIFSCGTISARHRAISKFLHPQIIFVVLLSSYFIDVIRAVRKFGLCQNTDFTPSFHGFHRRKCIIPLNIRYF